MFRKIFSLLLILTMTMPVYSQDSPPVPRTIDQNAPAVWDFKAYDKYSKSVVKLLRIKSTQYPRGWVNQVYGHGSGFIHFIDKTKKHPCKNMYWGEIITAAHVSDPKDMDNLSVAFQNGTITEAKMVSEACMLDVAVIACWIPAEYEAIPVSKTLPKYGDVVRVCGFGGDLCPITCPRYFETTVHRVSDYRYILLNEDVIGGDSGGLVLNSSGEAIGIVSSGFGCFSDKTVGKYHSSLNAITIGPMNIVISKKIIRNCETYTPEMYESDIKELFPEKK